MRIALLEDDPSQIELLQNWLTEAGHKSQAFKSSAELVRSLGRDSFDVMVFDWELPGKTGLELLRQLKSERKLETPVLFLTNRDNEVDIVAALDAGADDYIVKPARRLEFLARRNVASGAVFFGYAIGAHRPPFVVIAFQPGVEEISELAIASELLRRQVVVIIEDRFALGVSVIEVARRAGCQ